MARQWNVHEANSEPVACAYCETVFYTTKMNVKFCSPEHRRIFFKKKDKENRKAERRSRGIKARNPHNPDKPILGRTYNKVGDADDSTGWADARIAGLSVDEDPVYERASGFLEWDREEVLDYISKQPIVYAKFVDRIASEPTAEAVGLGKLEFALDNVSRRRIDAAKAMIRGEKALVNDILKNPRSGIKNLTHEERSEIAKNIWIERRKKTKSQLDWLA